MEVSNTEYIYEYGENVSLEPQTYLTNGEEFPERVHYSNGIYKNNKIKEMEKMQMKKRLCVIIIISAIGIVGFCGCGKAEKGISDGSVSAIQEDLLSSTIEEAVNDDVSVDANENISVNVEEAEREDTSIKTDNVTDNKNTKSTNDSSSTKNNQQTTNNAANTNNTTGSANSSGNTTEESVADNKDTSTTEQTKPAEIKTITLNVITSYHGVDGYFSKSRALRDVDLVAMGLAPDNDIIMASVTEYYDIETNEQIYFIADPRQKDGLGYELEYLVPRLGAYETPVYTK